MSVCPKCLAEYRDGFTICSDCGIPLVNNDDEGKALPVPSTKRLSSIPESFQDVLLANIEDRVELADVKSVLDEMTIPHRELAGDISSYLYILHGRSYMGTCLYVRSDDFPAAKEALSSHRSALLAHDIPPELKDLADDCESPNPLTFSIVFCIFIIQGILTGAL